MSDRCWAYLGPETQQGTWNGEERRVAADPGYSGSERRHGAPAEVGYGGAGESTGPTGREGASSQRVGPASAAAPAGSADWSRYRGGRDVDDV